MGVMTNFTTFTPQLYGSAPRPKTNVKEVSRLLTAAVVNQDFRKMLLANPRRAISSGYNGENFSLGTDDENLILSIQAATLADFALQLATLQHENGNKNGNGNGRQF